MKHTLSRRAFLGASAVAGAVARRSAASAPASPVVGATATRTPALLGGDPVRSAPFPDWPVIDAREDEALLEVLHGREWYRGSGEVARRFEDAYAALTGAKTMLLGPRSDMDDIAAAIRKIQAAAPDLARA